MKVDDLKHRVWGAGNKIFTVLGIVAGALVASGQYLDLIPEEYRSNRWYLLAAGLVSAGAWYRRTFPGERPGSPPSVAVMLVLGSLLFAAPARAAGPGVFCILGCPEEKMLMKLAGDTPLSGTAWFGPGLGVLPFVYNGATHEWRNPVQPVLSYGVWWRPPGYSQTKSLLGGNFSLTGDFSSMSHIDPLLTAVLFDNFTIGGGVRINFASGPQRTGLNGLFAVGWQTSFGGM